MKLIRNISRKIKELEMRVAPVIITVRDFDEENANSFIKEIGLAHNTGQPIIPVVIDSYGGDVYALNRMIDAIKSSQRKVATIIIGKALGCAAILAAMGTPGYRFISKHASMMLNNLTKEVSSKKDDFKPDIREVERLYKLVCDLVDNNCSQQTGFFEGLIKDKGGCDWYLESTDAIDFKLIDHIGSPYFEVDIHLAYSFDGIDYKENIHEID